MSHHFLLTVLCVSSVLSSITIHRTGWLDRVVQYYKNRFYDDIKKAPLVKIKARIERPPPGYTDSTQWDYKAVLGLLTLIRNSENAVDVRRVIKRTMKGSRRFLLTKNLKDFPSLSQSHSHLESKAHLASMKLGVINTARQYFTLDQTLPLYKNQPSDFYYSIDSGEYYADVTHEYEAFRPLSDNDVIVVTNPVEARLPSARISVHLLKSILENRAQAGRYMTSTLRTIFWLPMNTSAVNSTQEGLSNVSKTDGAGGTGGTTTGEVATTAVPAVSLSNTDKRNGIGQLE